jgi:hypothetical protein
MSQKASVTAGLMCAPLTLPTGEMAMSAPTLPNRNPVSARRAPAEARWAITGLPEPNVEDDERAAHADEQRGADELREPERPRVRLSAGVRGLRRGVAHGGWDVAQASSLSVSGRCA